MRGFFLLADWRAQREHPILCPSVPIGRPMTQEPLQSASYGHAQPLAEAVPSHGANTAANGVTNQDIAVPIPSQAGADTPSSGQVLSSTSLSKKCACILCLGIGTIDYANPGPLHCHFASCSWVKILRDHVWLRCLDYDKYFIHVKTHYRQEPNNQCTPFVCPVEPCRFKSKRWSDLSRHTTAKHCDNPAKFACSVIGCKYNGEGNGFTRKDKLIAHYKNMHHGQKVPGQAVRAIKPAPASHHAEASASSSMGAQG